MAGHDTASSTRSRAHSLSGNPAVVIHARHHFGQRLADVVKGVVSRRHAGAGPGRLSSAPSAPHGRGAPRTLRFAAMQTFSHVVDSGLAAEVMRRMAQGGEGCMTPSWPRRERARGDPSSSVTGLGDRDLRRRAMRAGRGRPDCLAVAGTGCGRGSAASGMAVP